MRKAIVAGQFYAATKEALNKQIESCFKHQLGPGMPRVPEKQGKIYGIISPHAGYQFSGPCAAHSYRELAQRKKEFPDTFILIGPNHSGYTRALFSLSLEDFETPLGVVENDSDLGKELIKEASQYGLEHDELGHMYEHSLEVQIPFLQFISAMIKKKFKIVPIIISSMEYEKFKEIASAIVKIVKDKKVGIIASSDFTHYGPAYGFLPFSLDKNTKNNIYDLDRKSINHILKFDSKAFYQEATKTTICGAAPIVIAIEACKALGSKKVQLLKYYTSGDITRDYSNAVGYAAVALE